MANNGPGRFCGSDDRTSKITRHGHLTKRNRRPDTGGQEAVAGTLDLISSGSDLARWIPIGVRWNLTEPLIDWCYAGEERFTEPFFDNSIEKLLARPYNLAFRRLTSIDALRQCSEANPSAQVAGIIFHMSRCGSTVASRALAASANNIVLSEAPPLDWMIRASVRRPEITRSEQVDWIRWMVMSLGQKRSDQAERVFIKLDAWHTLYFDLIKEAFPDVPWLFLFRDPVEVLVSLDRQSGSAVIPGALERLTGNLTMDRMLRCEQGEYPSLVLREICLAAIKNSDDEQGLFVDYQRMPGFVWGEMRTHFGLSRNETDIEQMKEATKFNAKSPTVKFSGDKAEKQAEASPRLREFADRHLSDIYLKLKEISSDQFLRFNEPDQI